VDATDSGVGQFTVRRDERLLPPQREPRPPRPRSPAVLRPATWRCSQRDTRALAPRILTRLILLAVASCSCWSSQPGRRRTAGPGRPDGRARRSPAALTAIGAGGVAGEAPLGRPFRYCRPQSADGVGRPTSTGGAAGLRGGRGCGRGLSARRGGPPCSLPVAPPAAPAHFETPTMHNKGKCSAGRIWSAPQTSMGDSYLAAIEFPQRWVASWFYPPHCVLT